MIQNKRLSKETVKKQTLNTCDALLYDGPSLTNTTFVPNSILFTPLTIQSSSVLRLIHMQLEDTQNNKYWSKHSYSIFHLICQFLIIQTCLPLQNFSSKIVVLLLSIIKIISL